MDEKKVEMAPARKGFVGASSREDGGRKKSRRLKKCLGRSDHQELFEQAV